MVTDYITKTGETVEVEYNYTPGEEDEFYDSNGDPGTQGYGPTVHIVNVWYSAIDRLGNFVSVDVTNLLEEEELEDNILESHEG